MSRGRLICLTGIDGSGKTTQAKRLVEWLQANGVKSVYVWSRGEEKIGKIFIFLGRKAIGTSKKEIDNNAIAYQEYQSRKSRLFRNPLVRFAWSSMVRAEHLWQISQSVRQYLNQGYLVVCDRYIWDSTIDLALSLNEGPQWLGGRMNQITWALAPKPAAAFLIDIPAEEAMRRKDDIPSLDYVQRRVDYYRFLSKNQRMVVIDGCDGLENIHTAIIRAVEKQVRG